MPRVAITVPDKKSQPYRFALDRKSVSLGRGSENDIVIDSSSVSVNHAVMERLEGGYQLRDLGSTNGTKLHGSVRTTIPLVDGLSVKLGDVSFDFSLSSEEQEVLSAETPATDSPITAEEPEEQRRAATPAPRHSHLESAKQLSPAASFAVILVGCGAFFLGMSLRYSSDNPGRSMVSDIKSPPVLEVPSTQGSGMNAEGGE
ncbi:MAG: FHA domain-containing protein [Verrucomicrobiales bacterium]